MLTAKMLRDAAERLKSQAYEPCPHVVHPRYAGRRLALTEAECDVMTRCAACFADIWLTRPSGNVGS